MGAVLELLGQDDAPSSPQYSTLLEDNHLDPTAARVLQINSLTVSACWLIIRILGLVVMVTLIISA